MLTRKTVIEVKMYPSQRQQATLDRWIELQNWVWNRGLALLEWRQWHQRWAVVVESGVSLDEVIPCPLRWYSDDQGGFALACDRVAWRKYDPQNPPDESKGEWKEQGAHGRWFVAYPATPEPVKAHWLNEPILNTVRAKNLYQKLAGCFGKAGLEHRLGNCPPKFAAGTCKSLADAWESSKSGLRGKPRYKGKRDRIRSLIHMNAHKKVDKATGEARNTWPRGNKFHIPNLGLVDCKALPMRWQGQPFSVVKIVREPSGYYLQITFDVEAKTAKPSSVVIGVDLGAAKDEANWIVDDQGRRISKPAIARLQRRLEQLQKKASRQYRRNKGVEGWQRRNLAKTYQQIGKLHERIRRMRLAHAHFAADRLVAQADIICVEDLTIENMMLTAKPKLNEETGHFEQNRAAQKSGLNRALAESGLGLFRRLLEEKAKERGRKVLRVDPRNTSATCHLCGFDHIKAGISKDLYRPHRALFHCQGCDRMLHADQNAAANIKQRGLQMLRDGVDVEQPVKAKRSTRKGYKAKSA